MTLFHGGRQFSALTAAPPPAQEGIVLPPPRPTNDAAGRIFIFFVDDLHLDFRNTARIRDLFKKIRKSLVHDGDMFGVVSTGPSSIAIDMTYDLKRLDEAMNKIAGNGLRPSDILQGGESADGPSEVRYRAHVAFSTAYELINNLESVHNRRKSLIYVSDGYDFNPFPESRYKAQQDMMGTGSTTASGTSADSGAAQNSSASSDASDLWNKQGQEFADADLARELSDLTRSANRANVTIYTIDPRGLVGMADLDETGLDQTEWQDYVRKSIDSLRVLADETGGYAMVNSNDFDKGLKRIDAETSDYYLIGYYSKNPDPLKRTRKIEVKVKRPGVEVRSRNAYNIKKASKPAVEKSK
jgi:VWFA-related protein